MIFLFKVVIVQVFHVIFFWQIFKNGCNHLPLPLGKFESQCFTKTLFFFLKEQPRGHLITHFGGIKQSKCMVNLRESNL